MKFKDWLEYKVSRGFETDIEAPVGSSDNPSNKILTVANGVTLSRMVLTIVFLVMFSLRINRVASIVIYIVAACTDWMDGQIARRTQTVSWFGKLLDPVCDRLLLFTGVLGLVITGELPAWVAVLIIGRDIYLAIGSRIVARFHERPIDVVYVGKIATALLMTGFSFLLLGAPVIEGLNLVSASWLPGLNDVGGSIGLLFIYGGCIFSLLTAYVYTAEGVAIVRESKRRKKCGL